MANQVVKREKHLDREQGDINTTPNRRKYWERNLSEPARVWFDEDTTKATKTAVTIVRRLRAIFINQNKLSWNEWLRLARITTGAKSRSAAETLQIIAESHDNHPQLQKDVSDLIETVFAIAADTIDAYQEYKREYKREIYC